MARSLKTKILVVLSLIFVLFTAAFFGFLNTEKNVASADSSGWTGRGNVYSDYYGWTGYGSGNEGYTFNTSNGYVDSSNVFGFGSRIVTSKPVKLDGAVITVYCDNVLTSGNDSDWFGFCLGSEIDQTYPTLTTYTQFCVNFRPRLWGQTRVSIGVNDLFDSMTGYIPVAFNDKALTNANISNVGVNEYVLNVAQMVGLVFEFHYLPSDNVWQINVSDPLGIMWEAGSKTVYASPDRIKAASGSGASTMVYLALFGNKGDNSPATSMATHVKIEDDNSRAAVPSISVAGDGTATITNITQMYDSEVRFNKDDKVSLDGLTVDLFDTAMPTTFGQYFGFGLAKNADDVPNSLFNSLNVVFAPGRWTNQTRLAFNNSANDMAGIVYADKELTSQAIGAGTHNYVFNNTANIGVRLNFKHLTEDGVWQIDITVTAGTLVGAHVSTVYFAESWANNVLDGNGKCYIVAYGFIATSGVDTPIRFSINVKDGFTVTEVIDGVTTTAKIAAGGTYTFKQRNSENKLNIGWTSGTTFYDVGSTLTVNSDLTVNADLVEFAQTEGASILLQHALDYSGIRFETRLKQTSYNTYSSKIAGIGIILMPADLIEDGKEFALANYGGATGAEDVYLSATNFDFDGGETCLRASIIKLYSSNYSRLFAARAYVKLANGNLVYTDFDTDKNARTIHSVAEKAIAAGEPDRGNCLAVYMDGVPNVTESGGTYSVVDKSGRADSSKIVKGVTGTTDGAAVTLNITVDVSKYNSVLGGAFKGIIYNGYRIKTFDQSINGNVVTLNFQKPIEKEYYQEGYETMAAKLKENYLDHVTAKRLTGVSYAVDINGEEKCRAIIGYSDCKQTKQLKIDSIFRIASMTKPITATAVMICKERGLLDLDAPISTYINFNHGGIGEIQNDQVVFKQSAREITLRDILSHSSGLGSGPVGDKQAQFTKVPETLKEFVEFLNGKYLDFAPGSRVGYSAIFAFELAAYTVETVTGIPYGEFIKQEILDPLGMKDTVYSLSAEQATRLVDLSLPDNKGNIEKIDLGLKGFDSFALGYTGGSAGLFSTLQDYMAFANMLANKGEFGGKRILSEASVNEMATPHINESDNYAWGIGVYVRRVQNSSQPLPAGSFGWSGAYGPHFWVDTENKFAAVLMLNHAGCGGSNSPFSAEYERLVQANLPE